MFATRSSEHRWSFKSNLGYKRLLGRVVQKKGDRVYPSVSGTCESDHRVVVMDTLFPAKRRQKEIFKKKVAKVRHNLDVRALRDSETITNEYSKRLDELLKCAQSSEQVDDIE